MLSFLPFFYLQIDYRLVVVAIVCLKGVSVLIYKNKIVTKCLFKLSQFVLPMATRSRTFVCTVFALRKKLQIRTADGNLNTKATYIYKNI